VVVHADQAGNYAAAGKIKHFGAIRNLGRAGISHRDNFSVGNDERLIRASGRSGPVDDAHVRQSQNGGVFPNERGHRRRKFGLRLTTRERCDEQKAKAG
jgi:hypothetical protein